jgi:hypothetical protein
MSRTPARRVTVPDGAGHGGAYADRCALDSADDGLFAIEHGQGDLAARVPHPVNHFGVIKFVLHVLKGRAHLGVETKHIATHTQIHARTKCFASPSDHDDTDVIVFASGLECINQFV